MIPNARRLTRIRGFWPLTVGMSFVALAACSPANPTSQREAAGLSAEDKTTIGQEAKARIEKRRFGNAYRPIYFCTQVFSLGEPTVSDASLGPDRGRVKVVIPIAVSNPIQSGTGQTAPDFQCYGYSKPGWMQGEFTEVAFQFDVERWETGWHVAQYQTDRRF